ncbi:MAG TPA: hypothetical protein VL137_01800, partial [Polyangiaceae bacterium]|nr:hypothetical protein [Polyangiaceae bacterium]
MSKRRPYLIIAALSAGVVFACSSSKDQGGAVSNNGAGGTSAGGMVGTSAAGAGASAGGSLTTSGGAAGAGGNGFPGGSGGTAGQSIGGQSTAGQGTGGQGTGGVNNVAGSSGSPNAGGAAAGGAAGDMGMAGSGGTGNPGNYPPPPRDILITGTDLVSMTTNGSTASFDASKTVQKKLVVPMGGVNSGPMIFGWAVQRGYHMIAVPVANGYPDDQYHREYLEAWSGENLGAGINQPPE